MDDLAADVAEAAPPDPLADVARLETLIERGVDGELTAAALLDAQADLADACLVAERFEQAFHAAVDLIFRAPEEPRFRALLGRVTAAARARGQALPMMPIIMPAVDEEPVAEEPAVVIPMAAATQIEDAPLIAHAPTVIEFPAPAVARADDRATWSEEDQAFEDLRNILIEEAAAAAETRMADARRMIERHELAAAIPALEEAMCAPHLRATAGAKLAGVYRDAGSPIEALEALEWVAEMPPANEESGHDLAYELALTLEALGQQAQALGIYRELLHEVGDSYRDVATRAGRIAAA
jgi:tetratricopeptide (TPR) repeat protein